MNAARGQPIWSTYEDIDMTRPCPNCHAEPEVWCSCPDGRVRRTPCLKRPRLRSSRSPDTDATVAVPAADEQELIDFSAPRHGREDG